MISSSLSLARRAYSFSAWYLSAMTFTDELLLAQSLTLCINLGGERHIGDLLFLLDGLGVRQCTPRGAEPDNNVLNLVPFWY